MPESPNPYIAGSPITGPEMFFGREDVFTFVSQALTGQHRDHVLVLYGQRRTGKTSVLYQMSRHLGERYVCIFVDLHGLALNGLAGFLWELASHIARVLRRDYHILLPALDRAAFQDEPRSAFEDAFLDSVWAAIGDRHLLLMLDEAIRLEEQVRAGKLEIQVFDYLRHLMQHHPRLNFLFSLGSGLEEMQKEYAFLFNVALYKKISFLDRASAVALITEPVKDGCPFQLAAVERILEVTSGHPYFTQLICHSLFNRCQGTGGVTLADVEAVLDEAVERGLAVLKHVWEESTPGEKAVLAAMAAAPSALGFAVPSHTRRRESGSAEIVQTWAELGVTLPESEASRAVRSLVARDVIVGADTYSFTVDLMRLWVQKFRRLDWVKEEIEDASRAWARREQEQERAVRDRQQRDREIQDQGVRTGQPLDERAGGIKPVVGKTTHRKPISLSFINIIVAVAGLLGIAYFASGLLGVLRVPPLGQQSSTAELSAEASLTSAGQESGTVPGSAAETPARARPVILGGDAAKVSDLALLGGYVWAATEGGLVRWSTGGAYRSYSGSDVGLQDDCINALVARPADSTLWMGCGGVAVVRVQGDDLVQLGFYNRDDGLGMGVVRAMALDQDGVIWAGGAPDEGDPPPLSAFTGQPEDQPWGQPEQLLDIIQQAGELANRIDISSIYITPENSFLLGLIQDGILFIGEGAVVHFGEAEGVGRSGLLDRRIRQLLIDRNGGVWAAASDQGLLYVRAGESQWRTVDVIPGGAPVRTVAEFADGSLWAGGDRLVVRSDDGGQTWTQVGTEDGLGSDIGALVQDEAGQVWAGAYTGGVSVWDGQRWNALQQ